MTARDQWDDLRPEFRRVVFTRGVQEVARELPAHRATVYRMIHGETTPSHALAEAVRRLVEREQEGAAT